MSYRVKRAFDFGARSFQRGDLVTDGDLRMADARAAVARRDQLIRVGLLEVEPEPVVQPAEPVAPKRTTTKKGGK